MQKKLSTYITVFICLVATLALQPTVFANSATDSTEATDSATEITTQELKKRIEKVVEEKREQIKGALQGIAANEKGFIGEVQRVTDEAVTVESTNETTIIPITPDIQLTKGTTNINIGDIAVGNWAIVIGKSSATGDFSPEKVLISTETLAPRPQVITMGSIQSITSQLVTVNSRLNGQEQKFIISRTSAIENVDGSTLQFRAFEKDMQVLLVGVETDKGIELKTMRALVEIE